MRQVSLNPLYLFSNFFKGKAIEYLIDKGAKTEYFNGDKLGLVLDKLYHKVLNYQDLRKDTIYTHDNFDELHALSRALAQLCGTQSPNYFYSKNQ